MEPMGRPFCVYVALHTMGSVLLDDGMMWVSVVMYTQCVFPITMLKSNGSNFHYACLHACVYLGMFDYACMCVCVCVCVCVHICVENIYSQQTSCLFTAWSWVQRVTCSHAITVISPGHRRGQAHHSQTDAAGCRWHRDQIACPSQTWRGFLLQSLHLPGLKVSVLSPPYLYTLIHW